MVAVQRVLCSGKDGKADFPNRLAAHLLWNIDATSFHFYSDEQMLRTARVIDVVDDAENEPRSKDDKPTVTNQESKYVALKACVGINAAGSHARTTVAINAVKTSTSRCTEKFTALPKICASTT